MSKLERSVTNCLKFGASGTGTVLSEFSPAFSAICRTSPAVCPFAVLMPPPAPSSSASDIAQQRNRVTAFMDRCGDRCGMFVLLRRLGVLRGFAPAPLHAALPLTKASRNCGKQAEGHEWAFRVTAQDL